VLVSATKGLETDSLARMSEVVTEETGGRYPVVALSGPSFAAEVARQRPTALVAASTDADAVRSVQQEFRGPAFRVYGSDDVVGVEVGAALKNIIAIAAGVVDSLALGHNALAALITRGLAEISRLACAMGGRRDTLSGLSGLGDLVLTCTGTLSRNRHVGVELGRGRPLDDVLASMRMVAEGVRTTEAALALGARNGVELPIAAQINELLAGRTTPRAALGELMLRPQRHEADMPMA
jgi:glycerol-3-phosphate dehydrogenase (NAD(P)+)